MSSPPKVTVMVPTFNQATFIAQAVSSILRQTYENLEVVIADDASTDATPEVVAQFAADSRVRVVRRERNLGRAANYRRTLYEDARGDWVLNLDGDDFALDDTFIAESVRAAQVHPRVVLVVGGCRLLEPDGRARDIRATSKSLEVVDGFDYFTSWHAELGVPHLAALYPRALATSLDFYRLNIISADWESFRRLVLRGDVALLGAIAGVWRQLDLSESNIASPDQRMADLQNIDNAYADALSLGLDRARLDRWRREAVADYVMLACRTYALRGEPAHARALLSLLRRQRPADFGPSLARMAARPTLWAAGALSVVGGRRWTRAAWSAWKRLTWRDS